MLIFELGTVGNGSSNFTFYFDDIRQANALPTIKQINLPVDFDTPGFNYAVTDFGNNNTVVIDGKPVNLTTNSVYQSGLVSRIEKNLDSNTHYRFNLEFDTYNSILETQVENYYILEPSIHTIIDIL